VLWAVALKINRGAIPGAESRTRVACYDDVGTPVRQRLINSLTLVSTLLLTLLLIAWARSYLQNDTFLRVGGGRMVALDCIRGELSLWTGTSGRGGDSVRYTHESISSDVGSTAFEALVAAPVIKQHWYLGFGYAEVRWLPSALRAAGGVRCFVVPMWFPALLLGLLPGWVLMRHMRREQDVSSKATVECRRCGAPMAADDVRCPQCSFPALVKRGMVA